jgi:hypothetical protein
MAKSLDFFSRKIVNLETTLHVFCAAERSQWSKNLDTCFFGEKNGTESSEQYRTELGESATTEIVVDDEVHPDFM